MFDAWRSHVIIDHDRAAWEHLVVRPFEALEYGAIEVTVVERERDVVGVLRSWDRAEEALVNVGRVEARSRKPIEVGIDGGREASLAEPGASILLCGRRQALPRVIHVEHMMRVPVAEFVHHHSKPHRRRAHKGAELHDGGGVGAQGLERVPEDEQLDLQPQLLLRCLTPQEPRV